jgi:hypothetical protein
MKNHPTMLRLETFVAGHADPEVQAHLEACSECRSLADTWREEAAAFRSASPAGPFVEKVRARSLQDTVLAGAGPKSVSLRLASSNPRTDAKPKRATWLPTASAIAAIAAGLFFVLRTPAVPIGIALDPGPSGVAFKGEAVQLAVIRERGGEQVRLLGGAEGVRVRAGDRLRAEVALDHAGPVQIALVRDDGKRWTLLAPTALEAGIAFSPESIRFDAEPFSGRLFAGETAQVEQAILRGETKGVRVIRIQSE